MTHTCIVGGWTEPRGSRPFFTALLLGVADDQDDLRYVGRVASGFTDAQLGQVWKQLHALKRRTSPFATTPQTRERAHWVKPQLAVRIQHSGWTKEGRFRRPVFAGLETDNRRERANDSHRLTPAHASTRP